MSSMHIVRLVYQMKCYLSFRLNMKDKINVAEILKDCPKGMELDCTLVENLIFDHIDEDSMDLICCLIKSDKGIISGMTFTKYGCYNTTEYDKCVIFPKGKTTWEGFVPPCKFKEGDIVYTKGGSLAILGGWATRSFYTICRLSSGRLLTDFILVEPERFATEEEKQKLFEAIKDKGYRWNAETKTLEKEEKKDKFDITALKPFDKVLVRNKESGHWMMEFFERVYENSYLCYKGFWDNCVPYWGNEHLLGTTDDCDDYYKIWKDETDE